MLNRLDNALLRAAQYIVDRIGGDYMRQRIGRALGIGATTTLTRASEAMTDLPFNINDNVRVKLTDYGRECLRRNHDELFARVGQKPNYPYQPPMETDGWSQWQLWDLMRELGPYVGVGFRHTPFETNIIIEVEST